MGDLEFFGGADGGGESYDPAAFERFKERIKRAAAQLQAQKKAEQKLKKTEDELIKVLLKFIQSGQKKDILLLVIRLLEQNVPAGFIISLLMISNEFIREELKVNLLPASKDEQNIQEGLIEQSFSTSKEGGSSQNLPDTYIGGRVLPLKIKIAIANWINEITRRVNENPHKVIKTTLDQDRLVQLSVIQLGSFCLRDFLEQENVPHEYDQLKNFISFILNDIIKKASDDLKDRKELKEGE